MLHVTQGIKALIIYRQIILTMAALFESNKNDAQKVVAW